MATDSKARFIVAVDFGTTFSGYAYAKRTEPERIFTCYDWPCFAKAGAKPYCKTLTALYYLPEQDKPDTFTLQDWGWSAFLKYVETTRRRPTPDFYHVDKRIRLMDDKIFNFHQKPLIPESDDVFFNFDEKPLVHKPVYMSDANLDLDQKPMNESLCISKGKLNVDHVIDALMVPQALNDTLGFFATKFKLYLTEDMKPLPKPSGDISMERMIVDYLNLLTAFIMSDLQQKYGKHVSKQDVQWCLTVPTIWDERAKQIMKLCAEKAGMVMGARCPNPVDASPHPLDIILEPEAASVYCQHKAKHLRLRKGDKMLIADVGGGTIDLVVHEKVDDDPTSMKVHEVVGSYGELGGGTFVDSHFFEWVCHKIGCFKQFCSSNPIVAIKLYEWWQSIKMGFDGDGYSAEWPLPRKLSEAWENYDAEKGSVIFDNNSYYDELRLEDSDIKQIFDKEVHKVLRLIQRQIQGVRALMFVGGFSASPYLKKQVKEHFGSLVEEIITPEDPGSAICHGAVQLHIGNDIIQSRIAKRTYGIQTTRNAMPGDPTGLLFTDDDGVIKCGSLFGVFVRAGDKVPLRQSVTRVYCPMQHCQKIICFKLFSSPNPYPRYTTDSGAKEEGSFSVDISQNMELDKRRAVQVTMCFGASMISVTAGCLNFGNPKSLRGLIVSFSSETQNHTKD